MAKKMSYPYLVHIWRNRGTSLNTVPWNTFEGGVLFVPQKCSFEFTILQSTETSDRLTKQRLIYHETTALNVRYRVSLIEHLRWSNNIFFAVYTRPPIQLLTADDTVRIGYSPEPPVNRTCTVVDWNTPFISLPASRIVPVRSVPWV